MAGYRSYTAIGEWGADLPAESAARLGIDARRRPSEAMIRRVLQALDGIDFPHAAQAIRIRRRRHALDQPRRWTTETVYAITDLRTHQAKPTQLAATIRGHRSIENQVHWVRDVTYDEDRSQIRTGTGPQVMAALHNAAISVLRAAGLTNIAAANRHHARDSHHPAPCASPARGPARARPRSTGSTTGLDDVSAVSGGRRITLIRVFRHDPA